MNLTSAINRWIVRLFKLIQPTVDEATCRTERILSPRKVFIQAALTPSAYSTGRYNHSFTGTLAFCLKFIAFPHRCILFWVVEINQIFHRFDALHSRLSHRIQCSFWILLSERQSFGLMIHWTRFTLLPIKLQACHSKCRCLSTGCLDMVPPYCQVPNFSSSNRAI